MITIPIAEPTLGKYEEDLVVEGIRSGWVSSIGKYIGQFEESFAKFCNTKYAITTSNGTSALHLTLLAAGIGPGDEVLVPSMTFVATANAVVYVGAKPVLVDSEMETWNIDPDKIKAKINSKTRAIIPVHLYGHPAEMGLINAIARKYNLIVIEDAAEAHGALYRGRKVGSIGDMGSFSFFGNKIITTGEGGMITTNNRNFANKIRIFRDHGASKTKRYHHPYLGYNYRMTNLQAALGLAQMRRIDQIIKRKREIAQDYKNQLSELQPEIVLAPQANWAESVFWMYSILIAKSPGKNRNLLMKYLKKNGIDSRPFFYPVHNHQRFQDKEKYQIASYLGECGLSLPSSINLTSEQISYICQKIKEYVNPNYGKN